MRERQRQTRRKPGTQSPEAKAARAPVRGDHASRAAEDALGSRAVMRTRTLVATVVVSTAAGLGIACDDASRLTGPSEVEAISYLDVAPAPATPPLPDADDRILFDTRAALQQATTMRQALAIWGFSADTRAYLAFTTDVDGAGTHAMRVDWPASSSCTSISPTISKSLPTPRAKGVYLRWKQRLGRTATGGGLGTVDGFRVHRDDCTSSGRFVGFADRDSSSNRLQYKWLGPSPAKPNFGVKGVVTLGPNRGWTFDPQQLVGQVIDQ